MTFYYNFCLYYLILLIFLIFQRSSTTIISCEGFIKSSIPVDLTKVQIKLFTTQGNLKHETECNPQNGYFLIPIYKQGKYLIKVVAPNGWIFALESREIEITGEKNDCSVELNFNLFGFKITGKVLTGGQTASTLILGLYDKNTNLIKTTTIDEKGLYNFDASPGKYIISPINGSSQCVDKGNIEIEVGDSPVEVKPDIKIAGQNLLVRVNDELGNTLNGATVIVYSDYEIKFNNLPINTKPPSVINEGKQWLYLLETAELGTVLFYCLPVGDYVISAIMAKPNIELNFEKKILHMDLEPKQVEIPLDSFNLSGYIFSGQSKPIEGAHIFLDDGLETESNNDGIFRLDIVKPGKHKIVTLKENYEFDKLQIKLSSKLNEKLQIKPKRLAICGGIYSLAQLEPIKFRIVSTLNGDVIDRFSTDSEGKYCRMLKPGKYIIRPISSMPFTPKQIEVDLLEDPILDLKFTQFKVKIGGIVKCFGNCNKIKIELWQTDQSISAQTVHSDGTFRFDEIPPSKYKLKIIDNESIWWDANEQEIEVLDTDKLNILFSQKGHIVEFQTSHPAVLKYWPKENKKNETNSEQTEVKLNPGSNFIGFTERNIYSFILESCHEFQQLEEAIFLVPSTNPIEFKGISSSVSMVVQTDKSKDSALRLYLRDSSGEELSAHHVLALKTQQVFVFYIPFTKIGSEFQIVTQSEKLLFLPDSFSFTFDGLCNDQLAKFKTTIGKFIEGMVIPKVAGVKVSARRHMDATEFTTDTDSEGKYRIGPVWNTKDFELHIYKEGFEFYAKPDNPKIFDAVKLSQFIIKFVDSNTKKPLSDVLVSISGGANYRSNNVTDASGMLNFIGLAPGLYYIRPILQEYKFNASSFSVVIKEGQTDEMVLEAKKFAYSVFGKVLTIGSKPIRVPIHVEAVSAECNNHQEEDLLDPKTEKFRIRGLKSQCSYRIALKDGGEQPVKAFPSFVILNIGAEDILNVNFMVLPMEQPNPTLVGQIELTDERSSVPTGNYRVALSDPGGIIQEQVVHSPASIFFFKLSEYLKEYSIAIHPLDANQAKYEYPSMNFIANSSFIYLRFTPRLKHRSGDVDMHDMHYYLGFALFLLITFTFMNRARTKCIVDYLLNTVAAFINKNNNSNRKFGINMTAAEVEALRKKKVTKK